MTEARLACMARGRRCSDVTPCMGDTTGDTPRPPSPVQRHVHSYGLSAANRAPGEEREAVPPRAEVCAPATVAAPSTISTAMDAMPRYPAILGGRCRDSAGRPCAVRSAAQRELAAAEC